MRNGTLTRELLWSTAAGKHVRVRSCRLVSFEHRHVAAMSYEVTVDERSPVVISSRVLHRDRPAGTRTVTTTEAALDPRLGKELDHRVLCHQYAEGAHGRLLLGFRTAHSGMTLGIGADHVIDLASPYEVRTSAVSSGRK